LKVIEGSRYGRVMAKQTIYVELLDEGVEVSRPDLAEKQTDGSFLLPRQAPEGEVWRFSPGSQVRCAARQTADGPALVAIGLAD
jgi:hypothetical protein